MRGVHALGFLVLALPGLAQEALRPAQRQEAWLSAAFATRLPDAWRGSLGTYYKRIRVKGELGYRSADEFLSGRQTYLELNARYKARKWLQLAMEHRFSLKAGSSALRHRSLVQATASRKWGRTEAAWRIIYQHSYVPWGKEREVFRNRLYLGYDFRKWKLDPEASVEFFTWAGYQGLSWTGTRWQVGTELALAKGHSLGIALVHDREQGIAWPTHRWIGSISYAFDLRELGMP